MPTIPIDPGGPPKRFIIELAFGEVGSAGYEFGRTPEEVNDALMRLNALMREWPFSLLSYAQPDYGVGSADEESGIADEYLNAIAGQLALRIAPTMGATLSPEAQANIARSLAVLRASVATIPTMPIAAQTPRGAGARSAFGPFISETADDVNGTV